MKLNLSQIKSITNGAVRVVEEENGFHFHRFAEEQEELYKGTDFYRKAPCTSGVQLRFKTDSKKLGLTVEVSEGTSRKYFAFDVFVNNTKIGTIDNFEGKDIPQNYTVWDLPLGEFSKEFSLADGVKEVKIVLPWSVIAVIKEMTLDDAAMIEPVKYDKKILCFGDSITQGYDALYPSNKYVSKLAEYLNAEEFNKAIGGEHFFPQLAATKEDFEPDYVVVAYGTNDWSHSSTEKLTGDCNRFYEYVCTNYPCAKVFAIAPIWRKNYQEEKPFGTFEQVAEVIKNAVKKYDNATFISAFDFVPKEESYFADLSLHPNDKGFAEYYSNFKKLICQ